MRSTIETMSRIMSDPPQAIKTLMMYEDPYGTTQSMAKMIQAGFLEKRDPHIVNLINMFRVNMLKDLKKKAKILIHKGAFLLGILDETRTLQEGEVFCQISAASNKGRGKKIIQGDVIVYRNPCFHPGDIRVVKAVNNPKLHHLKDVIVFSAQGYRDVPSMCSGGDLDGDDFTILWDDELLPHTRNYDPMEYKAEPPNKVDHVRLLHIFKFYIGYMENDNLGSIANAHLATADQSSKNARDGNCIRLAQLHSEAVDFPKTGRAAVMDDHLRVQVFPDFMEKEDKESYESQKVLGKIYRAIDKADYDEYESRLVDNTVYDVRLRVPDMEHYIQEARELKKEYGRDILALMNQYGVKTESELVSGYIIKWLKESNRKSDYEIHEETMKTVLSLKKNWRRRFEQDLEDVPGARHAKAASWYYCTYHPDERMNDNSLEGNLLSFPWVMDDVICEIAMMNNNRVATEDQAKPIDDALVRRLASAKKQDLKFTMIYSSDEEDADEEDEEGSGSDGEEDEETVENEDDKEDGDEEDDREEEDAITTFVLSKPQKHNKQESPKVSQETTITVPNVHTAVAANATEDELANALLGL
ncbi:RNA dependent RNA polymerase-domain-containing protein [Circinella umbellata]|nr:RNA dependent RNA polymerase-domain-containing protein [Circinella umbellata]